MRFNVDMSKLRLIEIRERFIQEVPGIMKAGAEELIQQTRPITPYDPKEDGEGHLEDSGEIRDFSVNFMAAHIWVEFSNEVDRPSGTYDYALIQERVNFNHPTKGEVQYVEKGSKKTPPGWELVIVQRVNSL